MARQEIGPGPIMRSDAVPATRCRDNVFSVSERRWVLRSTAVYRESKQAGSLGLCSAFTLQILPRMEGKDCL